MCENLQLFCALCRVGTYSLYRRLCCKSATPVKPTIPVLCLGLTGAGKSALLALMSGDSFHDLEPTVGFSIKALMFEDCFLDVKELGGGESVRPYWDRYYLGSQGVIFVVNSSSSEEILATATTEFHRALNHPHLSSLPLLVLANHQNVEGSRSPDEISKQLELESETGKRVWMIKGCSLLDKDSLNDVFLKFNRILLNNTEDTVKNGAGEINRV